MHELSTID